MNFWNARRSSVLRKDLRLEDVAAHSGSKPTIERTLSRWAVPSGRRSTS
jgi:hypothetical protein